MNAPLGVSLRLPRHRVTEVHHELLVPEWTAPLVADEDSTPAVPWVVRVILVVATVQHVSIDAVRPDLLAVPVRGVAILPERPPDRCAFAPELLLDGRETDLFFG